MTAERGRHGYYSLVAGFKLPPMMFSDDEALARLPVSFDGREPSGLPMALVTRAKKRVAMAKITSN